MGHRRFYPGRVAGNDNGEKGRITFGMQLLCDKAGGSYDRSIVMKQNSFARIYEIVKKIPKGKVATYGQIALMAGNPRWSRVVGYALHVNPDPDRIPCFRVVNRFGEVSSAFAFGGENRQIGLLRQEGVTFLEEGRVDLKKHQWDGISE